ncbi:protealysin inhibitor emfourin [Streptomyces flavochromogenes]|uniref:protealysin inhibitor emfourin n=1 Tax=Streptomyces flavochromogenes TaxID=68199 RepID=UPI0004C09EA4|nr:protealysin inhibitor emfourin [Streptomyces flavochromogenes]
MRIRVRRTGGFAGIERSAEVEVSDREWESLATAVLDEGESDVRGVPDGFSYEITIDGVTVRCCDPRLSEAQRALVTRVLKEGA